MARLARQPLLSDYTSNTPTCNALTETSRETSPVANDAHLSDDLRKQHRPVVDSKVDQKVRPIVFPREFIICYAEHPHTLTWTSFKFEPVDEKQLLRFCDWCLQGTTDHERLFDKDVYQWTYHCHKCAYDVCHSCAEKIRPVKTWVRDENSFRDKPLYPKGDGKRYVQAETHIEPKEEIAFAFSGGGIRSASFCAGALKTFIKCYERAPHTISSVSGGGYLASSFIHWARAHAWSDTNIMHWYKEYFSNFEKNVGYFVRDWFHEMPSSAVYGFSDFVYFLSRLSAWLVTLLAVAIPAFFPYAIVIDTWFHSTLLASAHGWQLYTVPTLLGGGALVSTVIKSFLNGYEAAERLKARNYQSILLECGQSLTWVSSVVLLLTSVLLLLSNVNLNSFLAICAIGFLCVKFVFVSAQSVMMGWILMLIAAFLAYWYACVLSWFANRNGEYNDQGELTETDKPLYFPGVGNVHYHTFDRVPLAGSTGEVYTCVGYGQVIMATMITLACFRSVFLTYRDSVMPLYYRRSLRSAFYYVPSACHCGGVQCEVITQQSALRHMHDFIQHLKSISVLEIFQRDIVTVGLIVAIPQLVQRILEKILGMFCFIRWFRGGPAYEWKAWSHHQLTKFHTWYRDIEWDQTVRPPSDNKEDTQVHNSNDLNTKFQNVTEWRCVMTLNQRTQYDQKETFNQFIASTSGFRKAHQRPQDPNMAPQDPNVVIGLPLTALEGPQEMRKYQTHHHKLHGASDATIDDVISSPNQTHSQNFSQPEFTLDDGMSISAAAISYGIGRFSHGLSAIRGVLGLHGLFGLSLSKDVYTKPYLSIFWEWGFVPFFFHHIVLITEMILVWYALPSLAVGQVSNTIFSLLTFVYTGLLIVEVLIMSCWHTDAVELVPIFRAARQLIGLPRIDFSQHTNEDSMADNPSGNKNVEYGLLNLSDGGHTENFGLLPLLADRKPLIVLCDGGADPMQQMNDLIDVLTTCREVWRIRFQVMPGGMEYDLFDEKYDNWDLKEDILQWAHREPFIDARKSNSPNSRTPESNDDRRHVLRIVVHYPATQGKAETTGLLLYLKPRFCYDIPPLVPHPARKLFGCCCQCCNTSVFSLLRNINGEFPHHFTGNQFFTAEHYRWYEGEGIQAFQEAYQWIRIWQHDLHRYLQISKLRLKYSTHFGIERKVAGWQKDHLYQVPVNALICKIELFYRSVLDPAPYDYVCGMRVTYVYRDERGKLIFPFTEDGLLRFPMFPRPGPELPSVVKYENDYDSITHSLNQSINQSKPAEFALSKLDEEDRKSVVEENVVYPGNVRDRRIRAVHIMYGKAPDECMQKDLIMDMSFATSSFDPHPFKDIDLYRTPKFSVNLSTVSFDDRSLFRMSTSAVFLFNPMRGIGFTFAANDEIAKLEICVQ